MASLTITSELYHIFFWYRDHRLKWRTHFSKKKHNWKMTRHYTITINLEAYVYNNSYTTSKILFIQV